MSCAELVAHDLCFCKLGSTSAVRDNIQLRPALLDGKRQINAFTKHYSQNECASSVELFKETVFLPLPHGFGRVADAHHRLLWRTRTSRLTISSKRILCFFRDRALLFLFQFWLFRMPAKKALPFLPARLFSKTSNRVLLSDSVLLVSREHSTFCYKYPSSS